MSQCGFTKQNARKLGYGLSGTQPRRYATGAGHARQVTTTGGRCEIAWTTANARRLESAISVRTRWCNWRRERSVSGGDRLKHLLHAFERAADRARDAAGFRIDSCRLGRTLRLGQRPGCLGGPSSSRRRLMKLCGIAGYQWPCRRTLLGSRSGSATHCKDERCSGSGDQPVSHQILSGLSFIHYRRHSCGLHIGKIWRILGRKYT